MFTIVIYDKNKQEVGKIEIQEDLVLRYLRKLNLEGFIPIVTEHRKVA